MYSVARKLRRVPRRKLGETLTKQTVLEQLRIIYGPKPNPFSEVLVGEIEIGRGYLRHQE